MSTNTIAIVETSEGTGVPKSTASGGGRDGLEFLQLGMYGVISRPPIESLAVLLPLNSDASNCVGITDDPDKGQMPSLEIGEVAIGNYASGSYIHFKNDGTVYIKGKIVHDGDNEQTGDHVQAGSHTVTGGDVVADGVSLKNHLHPYTDDGAAMITGAPNAGP